MENAIIAASIVCIPLIISGFIAVYIEERKLNKLTA
jgi:hypothetical protein